MPLGDFERDVLRLIAANRNPDSFVAGATVLHQAPESLRCSRDVDVFHDTVESLAVAVEADTAALRAAGYEIEMAGSQETFRRAIVRKSGEQTKLEWAFDSAFRFFPVEADAQLGWRLHFWDAATNKVLALFGRETIRDYVDCVFLHRSHLHIGALIWAAAGKDAGLTPEMILDWARRTTRYQQEDLDQLQLTRPVDLHELKLVWLQATAEAAALFQKLPMADMGCFYLDAAGSPVCPDPSAPGFPHLTRHFGSLKGAWPRVAKN